MSLITHLPSASFYILAIGVHISAHTHTQTYSSARKTINPGLMSSGGETTASQRQINISPPCFYIRQQEPRNQAKFTARSTLNATTFFSSCRRGKNKNVNVEAKSRKYGKRISAADEFGPHKDEHEETRRKRWLKKQRMKQKYWSSSVSQCV